MNSSLEYGAFKNNHSRPYTKVAKGIERSSAIPDDRSTESLSGLGRLGVSIVKRDDNGSLSLDYVNPHEAENRAAIEARLKIIYESYIQAARLAIPSPRENERSIFGRIKEPFQTTTGSDVSIALNGRYKKKKTQFSYKATEEYNKLRYGYTSIEDEPIGTTVYFDNDEQISAIELSLFINHVGSKEGEFPPELAPVVKLKNDLRWNGVFKIYFSLVPGEIGAKITNRGSYITPTPEELIYNSATNTFDFKSNATLESLTPDSFIRLVEACIAFTPLEKI